MKRRFVNLVIKNHAELFYSLRRIDPYDHFFYGSARAVLEAADEATRKKESSFPAMQTLQLPPPSMNFTAATASGNISLFALLSPRGGSSSSSSSSEGRILYANSEGEAGLYDADKNSQNTMGRLNEPKNTDPVCLPVVHPGDPGQSKLYVLDRNPQVRQLGMPADGCFEVLESVCTRRWRWRRLPPPPFVLQEGYTCSTITSYATKVDDYGYPTIYISGGHGHGIGTYRFETASRYERTEKWSLVGEWHLPFIGGAQYVPDFNRWFGFSRSVPHHLCALNLSAMGRERPHLYGMDHERPPTTQQVWQDLNTPEGEEWLVVNANLVNLGDGKFLIAKTFEKVPTGQKFTVLSGIEMMMAGDKSLRMVKHKCARFDVGKESIQWVL